MTFRITIGIDPGHTGALAVLADEVPAKFIDMPTCERNGVTRVDGAELSALLRGVMQMHPGAHCIAVVEDVQPGSGSVADGSEGGKRRSMGSSSAFRFGKAAGVIDGVLGALGITQVPAKPQQWKKHYGLMRDKANPVPESQFKDRSRLLALQLYPNAAQSLARKKDGGRAEALLIARWAHETEQAALQAAA
jgi:hypothetical protein